MPQLLAANALTTIIMAELELGLVAGQQDIKLARIINAASQAIEGYCSRRFQRKTQVDTIPLPGGPHLLLGRTPLISITSVLLDGTAVDATTYSIKDADAGILYKESGWAWTAAYQTKVASPELMPGTERESCVATYIGGYILPNDTGTRDLPYDLEQACLETINSAWRRSARDPNIQSESLGSASVLYAGGVKGIGILPSTVLSILNQYRRAI